MKYYFFVTRDNDLNYMSSAGYFKNKAELIIKQYPKVVLTIIQINKKEFDELYDWINNK